MKFKKSLVASVVTSALSLTVLSAVADDSANKSFSTQKLSYKAFASTNVSDVATISGMQNQFDRGINQQTFQWATKQHAKPNLSTIAADKKLAYAADFYLNQLTGYSSQKSGASKVFLSSVHEQKRGANIAKYKQQVAGIEIFNREYNVMMDEAFNFVASSGYLADKSAVALSSPQLRALPLAFGDASNAIKQAFSVSANNPATIKITSQDVKGQYTEFQVENLDTSKQLIGTPRAKKVLFELKGRLIPAHYVEIEVSEIDSVDSTFFAYVIDAKTQHVLFKNDLSSHAAEFNYRVYADEQGAPFDSPHGNVIPAASNANPLDYLSAAYLPAPLLSLAHGPISTEDAWLADDATETIGNNVVAYVDAIAPQGLTNGDYTAETTSTATFDYAYDASQSEYSVNNRKAAIVNLFFMINYLHDDFYDHGFDEVAGNAQLNNYERGGVEGDPLLAEVQDNSGTNNANMSTPSDGGSPRMQMYLWDKPAQNGVDFGVTVTSTDIGLLDSGRTARFGPQTFEEVTGKLVILDDGTDVTNDGCEEAINTSALAGNIAIIDRGGCSFTSKALAAQNAGAIAVIVANNKDGDATIIMSGDDDRITIPSMSISQNDGIAVYAAMAEADVTISMFSEQSGRDFKASSWDNGIVAHEWGHYISNRLVGNSNGLINNQGRSMGEGWGDFHALLLLSEESDNTILGNDSYNGAYSATSYVAPFTSGIRRVPYSTDMMINPLTFSDIGISARVHDSGEIWATMLWESFVGLANDDRHSFNEAKDLMKDYLVAGYKMTPIAPTYTEARDAILAAAYANDVEDYKVILAAFAKRGMGLGAVSPSRYSTDHAGVVESDKVELSTFIVNNHNLNANYEGLTTGYCTNDNILDKGETGTVSFTVSNKGSESLSNIQGKVEVLSGHDVTFANEGVVSFDSIAVFGQSDSAPIEFTLNDAGVGEELVLKLTFPEINEAIEAGEYSLTTTVNIGFEESASKSDDMETLSTLNDFSENVMLGGELAKGTASMDGSFAALFPDYFGVDVGEQYLLIQNNAFASDVAYETRAFTVGFEGDFIIDWFHYFDFEVSEDEETGEVLAAWDGGVVEISVNGGEWADVTEMGGTFLGDGYTYELSDYNPGLPGRNSFTGFNVGYEAVSFGSALNGNEVRFRFRVASDSVVNNLGWIIDSINFSNVETNFLSSVVAGDALACDNRLPFVTASDDVTAQEGSAVTLSVSATDPNGDALTYAWEQTSGPTATLSGADTTELSFTAPSVSDTSTLTFNVTVDDGTDAVIKAVNVTVNKKPAPVVEKPKPKSGGGSTGLFSLLLLPLALLRRRNK